ncbi:hypothetical protein BBD42_29645 [Paenibacillus sp. BIHB 4019]|uniref:DNA-binding response regulator n=1 Tax=Paenibacillus sp. BIHB 4019 TaxID=1870819 RepID=A0A1B2DR75_9BACL|nr:helix-turn-helix domain-containing protein [Paenibacillus sp. BIHB 4019]ANY70206.1 hypothetical protein BBD42_29645 [Paenibacillus sp. BIHB 4019]
MHHILLVDDEIHSIRGLQAGVQWAQLHITQVFTANSLKQAQEIFREHRVDIMVCDIEMPQGSGLELLQWVRQAFPRVVTIFLTCHSDFDYAREAVRLHSFEYLLKPVDYEELESVIQKGLDKVTKENELHAYEEAYKKAQRLWESNQPLVAEKFWQDLFRKAIPSSQDRLLAHIQMLGLPYHAGMRFLPVYIAVQRWHQPLSQRDERIMEYALRNAAEEQIARNDAQAAIVSLYEHSLLLILPVRDNLRFSEVKGWCDLYIANCHQYFYCDICCYIGKPSGFGSLAENVGLLKDMDDNNIALKNMTFLLEARPQSSEPIEFALSNEWGELLKQGSKERLMEKIGIYLEEWRQKPSRLNAKALHLFYQDFLQMIFSVLQAKGIQANQVFADQLLATKSVNSLRSLAELEERIYDMIEITHSSIHAADKNLSVVEKVRRFINLSFGEHHLTREDIANQVYLNPDYLTRIFKKETGLSISDYLMHQRLEYAKKLLRTTGQSVSDIALASGYSNLSYFSTTFKKAVGVNPVEFRKQT